MAPTQKWLDRLEQIVREDPLAGSLSNTELAQRIAISERHLIRQVKQATGLSPQKYIRKHRLQLARQHLEKGRCKTVREAALAIGYANVSYFIQQFEKEFGQKPLKTLRDAGWR
ncbi:MAG: helix-turn-helix domain-containing protein [Bacteroidota bacterium]